MNRKALSALAAALVLVACEINIENPGVDSDAGVNNSVDNNANNATNANNINNIQPNNTATNNNANNTTTNNNANNTNANNNSTVANDEYPCQDDPDILKEQCQGGVEWDQYEGDAELIGRGQYLVRHVAACVDCHTPVTADFVPKEACDAIWSNRDCEKELAGFNLPFFDYAPFTPELGNVGIPNLTPHPDGLGEWGPEDLRTAFIKGIRPEFETEKPRLLFPVMPYWVFNTMTDADADAIIAYLHSLPPIPSGEPGTVSEMGVPMPGSGPSDREPQPEDSPLRPLDLAEPEMVDGGLDGIGPVPDDFMPAITLDPGDPDYAQAEEGKYLATFACAYCHTPAFAPEPGTAPEDIASTYTWTAPDRAMCGSEVGVGVMPFSSWTPGFFFGPPGTFPEEIHAQNITGHATFGVGDWTVDELVRAVNGIDKQNEPMCPPMYVDTWFSLLTAEDKEAIATYLKYSEPCDNDTEGMSFDCKVPGN